MPRYNWSEIAQKIARIHVGRKSHILVIEFQEVTHPEMMAEFLANAQLEIRHGKKVVILQKRPCLHLEKQYYSSKISLVLGTKVTFGKKLISETKFQIAAGYFATFSPLFGNYREKFSLTIEGGTDEKRKD